MRLCGGLGNQMFQYALGRRLALLRKTSLWLDLTWFAEAAKLGQTARIYRLNHLRIRARCLPDWIGRPALRDQGSVVARILAEWLSSFRRAEQVTSFDAGVLECPRFAYLDGYWQTEKYFAPISAVVRADFELAAPMSEPRREILGRIRDRVSTSVHVRRGDYATDPRTNAFHGTCSPNWYRNAMQRMADGVTNNCFVVFSDDIAWARANLPCYPDTIFVDSQDGRDYEDMRLMACCQNHIVANSSFSWWGAWLNPSSSKKVIAPRRWFAVESDMTDRIPETWMMM